MLLYAVHIVHIATYSHIKFHAPNFDNFKVITGFRIQQTAEQTKTGRENKMLCILYTLLPIYISSFMHLALIVLK